MSAQNMPLKNLINYIAAHSSRTMEEAPPTAVDGLVFSAMSYIHFDGLIPDSPDEAPTIKKMARAILSLTERERLSRVRSSENQDLLHALAESRRFASLRLTGFRDIKSPDLEMQFSAVTILQDNGNAFVVFRGTDGTLIGWKEDFNLSFQDTVPGQWAACRYLENMSSRAFGSLWVCGHSKGGNLAVFAASCASPSVTSRIQAVFNYDGPGFSRTVLSSHGYQAALPLIQTFVPQSSVVGMLLGHEEPYTVVLSSQKGLMQHDPYSWVIQNSSFVRLEDITEESCLIDRTLKAWISSLSLQERETIVDTMYEILQSSGAKRTGELLLPDNILEIAGSFLKESPDKKWDTLLHPLLLLIKAAGKTFENFYLKGL